MVAVIHSNEKPRRRALVVDDSRIARHVLSGMLDRLGFEVETVDSAEAALNRLSGYPADVVFMDHILPGMQGLEAVRKLRARADAAALRIVMFTSQDGDLFADVARAAGADDIFVKTADSGALEVTLERLDLLSGKSQIRADRGKVVQLPSSRETSGDSLSLEKLLEPILDQHRENLRQDLLSEFAILERYEERMRLETLRRLDALTKQAAASIERSLEQRRRAPAARMSTRKRPLLRAAAVIAALCTGLALGSVIGESGNEAAPPKTGAESVAMLLD